MSGPVSASACSEDTSVSIGCGEAVFAGVGAEGVDEPESRVGRIQAAASNTSRARDIKLR